MIRKQNIVTPLLLLLWATMFCFSVTHKLQHSRTAPVPTFTAAFQNNEELTPEEQDHPVAWAEQSAPTVAANAPDSSLPLCTSLLVAAVPVQAYLSLKPGKVLHTFTCAVIRFRIFPNGP